MEKSIGSHRLQDCNLVSLPLVYNIRPLATVCWLIKSDCVSLDGGECHPLVITGTAVIINHLFSSAGRYCLSVKAQNEVSKLLGHQSITVTNAGVHPVWFVLPCCAFIAIAIGFICYTLFRAGSHSPHQKSLVENCYNSLLKNIRTK
ncbi:unnamed protein product [Ranitomeya imitator]|uniref:Uncharacterized protein n=1 Tax=Ranitomeya imitator TaxID=111125 RepID=A0ABN9KXP1_9NEOB|nr:unnamed protein product [Ranitomeya imitator]